MPEIAFFVIRRNMHENSRKLEERALKDK